MNVNWIVDSALAPIPRADPEEVVLSFETDQSWTRRELYERRNQLARLLSELGIGAGDRVGLLLHNCLDYYALYFACGLLGAISVRAELPACGTRGGIRRPRLGVPGADLP